MEATQHGAELLDLGNELSADLIAEYSEDLLSRFASVFRKVLGSDREREADRMAQNLLFWLEGMKAQIKPLDEREAYLREFVALQFKAIRAD